MLTNLLLSVIILLVGILGLQVIYLAILSFSFPNIAKDLIIEYKTKKESL